MSSAARTRESNRKDEGTDGQSEEIGGRFRTLQLVQIDFEDGSSVTAPDGDIALSRSVAGTVGDIVTIACKLFPSLCAPPKAPDKKPGCYTITGPDGTTITICPPGAGGGIA